MKKEEKKEPRYEYHQSHHWGLYIKEARLRQGQRLTEVAQGICAISLLSRIESGAFEPTPLVFEKLAHRLEIRFPKVRHHDVLETFKTLMYRNAFKKMEALLASDQLHDYEKTLLLYTLQVKQGAYAQAAVLKKAIDKWCIHLNAAEMQWYRLFNGMYFFALKDWEQGIAQLQASYQVAKDVKKEPLLQMEMAKYYFKIKRPHLGFVFTEQAMEALQWHFAPALVMACLVMRCEAQLAAGDFDATQEELARLFRLLEPKDSAYFSSAHLRLSGQLAHKRGEAAKAAAMFAELARKEVLTPACLEALLVFHYETKNWEAIGELAQAVEIRQLSDRLKVMFDYYYYKISDADANDFELFLLDDAMTQATLDWDAALLELYAKELIEIYRARKSNKGMVLAYEKLEQFRLRVASLPTFQRGVF